MHPEKPRSNWWYMLPIFLGLIGGIIAFFVIRKDDPRKAKNCLFIGIGLAIIGIILNILFAFELSQIEEGFDFGINV